MKRSFDDRNYVIEVKSYSFFSEISKQISKYGVWQNIKTHEFFLRDARTTRTNVALPDSMINNNSPNNLTDCSCDNDAKSGNSPNDFISSTAMTSSGFTTSSGLQDSPDKFPDKDAKLSEQFVDMTFIQKFDFTGYLSRYVSVNYSHPVKIEIFSFNNTFSVEYLDGIEAIKNC